MTTTTTPRTLRELKYQNFVFTAKPGEKPEDIARRFFKEVFDFDGEPTVNPLFSEDDHKVYESYIDSGSVDYIYIIS